MLSQRCWSQSRYSNSLPDLFTTMFASTASEAEAGMSNAHLLWDTILHAVRVARSGTGAGTSSLQLCLKCIYWKDHIFVKEAATLLDRCDWAYDDDDARTMLWGYAGSLINTKTPNEDVFNTLRDKGRDNKNKRMNRHRSWYLANQCPFLGDHSDSGCGYGHLILPASDFEHPLEVSVKKIGEGIFTPAGHKVHESIDSMSLLLPESKRPNPWQPAGQIAERKSVAAAALLRQDRASDFRQLETRSWCDLHQKSALEISSKAISRGTPRF